MKSIPPENEKIAVPSDYLPEGRTLASHITKYERAKLHSLQMLEFIESELRKCSPSQLPVSFYQLP